MFGNFRDQLAIKFGLEFDKKFGRLHVNTCNQFHLKNMNNSLYFILTFSEENDNKRNASKTRLSHSLNFSEYYFVQQHCVFSSCVFSSTYIASEIYTTKDVFSIPGSSSQPDHFIYSSREIPCSDWSVRFRGINSESSSLLSGVLHIRLFRIRSAHLTGYFMLHV